MIKSQLIFGGGSGSTPVQQRRDGTVISTVIKETLHPPMKTPVTSTSSTLPQFSFLRYIEGWNGKQIARWIEGLGELMNPFLGSIRDNIRSGRHLVLVDDDILLGMGISALGPRKMILQAVQLLLYFCHEAPTENLQSLTMRVVVQCNAVSREMLEAMRMKEKAMRRSQIVSILNNITQSVSILAEHVKRLIFWLDRSPFDEMEHYVEIRNQISILIWNLVWNVNAQPKVLFTVAPDIIQKANELKEVCETVVRSDDPPVLYTSFVERAVLRRHDKSTNWGLNLQSSYRGIHVVSEVKIGSPADLCQRIDAGDEILLINGKTVVGWDLTCVAKRIGSCGDSELELVINKRPREAVPVLLKNNQKAAAKPLVKLAPGSLATNAAETEGEKNIMQLQDVEYTVNRRRSSTFVAELLRIIQQKRATMKRTRRASISCGTPHRDAESEKTNQQWDLLELIGHPAPDGATATRVVRRARTMRHQPDGYVRSFIDNKLVQEVEDDTVAEQLPFNIKCPSEFAEVTVVDASELTAMNISEPRVTDPEWIAPIAELAVQPFRAPAGDSNLSGFCLDSPRRILYSLDDSISGSGVVPSPSSSSVNSGSPAPGKLDLMSSSAIEWGTRAGSHDLPSPSTPGSRGGEKIFEGWVRRRKTPSELLVNEFTKKWPKCWMKLCGPNLTIHASQYVKRPDIAINVARAVVSDATELKTSKKFVFRLSRPPMEYHFSCYSHADMRGWMNKIALASEAYGGSRIMSKSVSYIKGSDGLEDNSHYNTLTGLPSLMSQSHTESCLGPTTPSGGHNTLPRTGLLSTLHIGKSANLGSPLSSKPRK